MQMSTYDNYRVDKLIQLIQSWIDEGDADEQRETFDYFGLLFTQYPE